MRLTAVDQRIDGSMQTMCQLEKERKKTDNPREGWEDGTPPPHRDFKERSVVLAIAYPTLGLVCLFLSPFAVVRGRECGCEFFLVYLC